MIDQFQPEHDFFIGIDSDGCVFDTMEIKHKECFTPNIIKFWNLQAVSRYAREVCEFVNLYSVWRGTNRWTGIILVLDLLRQRTEVQQRGVDILSAEDLRQFINQNQYPLSNDGIKAYMAAYPEADLETALIWSNAVNDSIHDMVHGIPPFSYVHKALEAMHSRADMIVVSATPVATLEKEWREHDIARFVRLIGGQELGSKSQIIQQAAAGKYAPEHILMIGDAPGDLRAVRTVNGLFYPIIPGHEESSWQRFHDEAMPRFFAGTYAGAYEAKLIKEYESHLPETPPWQV